MGEQGVVEEMWAWSRSHQNNGQIRHLRRSVWDLLEVLESSLTISPKRAMAGSNVGAGSLWQSMPSSTSINLPRPSRTCCNCATKALMLSHLPSPSSSTSTVVYSFNEPLTERIVRSSRCRVVTHSRDCIMPDGVSVASNIALMVRLFPVASTP